MSTSKPLGKINCLGEKARKSFQFCLVTRSPVAQANPELAM